MINKEEIGYLIGSVSILRDEHIQFTEKSRNKLADRIANLIKEYQDLEEINEEHQKLNGELQKKVTYYEEICKGKTIQEMGMSDLYEEKKDD